MTAEEVYELALSYVFERKRQDKEYLDFFPLFLNTVMQEALAYENMLRRKSGSIALAIAPRITAEQMNEELDFSESLCRVALPYGVAAFYCQDDGDSYRAADYRNRFIIALQEAVTAVDGANVGDIEDAYSYGAALDN
ncbi:MAG: hypothetical protein IKL36_08395 [Clostridia bacterium]|nr:hypothetical protein [Clostridia bacterium]